MYGPGPIPVPPRPGERPAVRVLWVLWRIVLMAVPVVSIGMLAWAPFVWILVARRRVRDWLLLAACVLVDVGVFVLFGMSTSDSDWQGNAGAAGAFLLMGAVPVYLLVADLQVARLRRERRLAEMAALPAYPGYYPAYPGAAATHFPAPGYPAPAPAPAASPMPPQAAPAPAAPQPERVAQVRAELDELSRLLREQGQSE